MVNIGDSEAYISLYCVDNDDWFDCSEDKKLRMLNVAARTLTTKYPTYTVPDNAIYEFSNVLATVFSDTNRLAQQGVSQISISGTAAFTFKDGGVREPGADIARFIPQAALDLISAANGGVKLSRRNVGWTVL